VAILSKSIYSQDFSIIRLSQKQLAERARLKEQQEAAAKIERDRNDPALQARLRAAHEKALREEQARKDQAEKDYWIERSKPQLGDINSWGTLQRVTREKIAAGKAVVSTQYGGGSVPNTWNASPVFPVSEPIKD
jgi:transcriptional regulator with XRE-family HTH domain